jgi:hypothetical protein
MHTHKHAAARFVSPLQPLDLLRDTAPSAQIEVADTEIGAMANAKRLL